MVSQPVKITKAQSLLSLFFTTLLHNRFLENALGRFLANVKFTVEQVLDDGSYLSWIYPDGKSKKKGGQPIRVRVIEYTLELDGQPQTYHLITSLMDTVLFPALSLATENHQRWEIENTIDELRTHLNGRKTPIRSETMRQFRSCYP